MASLNKQSLIGRLGKDVELKHSNGGNAYCFLSVATDDYVGKKDGQTQTKTNWHNVTVFGQSAEYVAKYGKKGVQVYVEGRTDHEKDDKDQYRTKVIADKVIVLGSNSEGGSSNGAAAASSTSSNGNGNGNGAKAQTQAAPPAEVAQAEAAAAVPDSAGEDAGGDNDLPF